MSATEGPRPEEVGSLAEEAQKLWSAALHGWAQEQDLGSDGHGPDSGATGVPPECRWCPWCRTLHAMREVSPEVAEHLAAAASSLAQAALAFLAPPTPEPPVSTRPPRDRDRGPGRPPDGDPDPQ